MLIYVGIPYYSSYGYVYKTFTYIYNNPVRKQLYTIKGMIIVKKFELKFANVLYCNLAEMLYFSIIYVQVC